MNVYRKGQVVMTPPLNSMIESYCALNPLKQYCFLKPLESPRPPEAILFLKTPVVRWDPLKDGTQRVTEEYLFGAPSFPLAPITSTL